MPTTRRFRTTPTTHGKTHFSLAESGIDRENLRLHNVVGMETGLALGHNVIADEKTLQIVADIANERNGQASDFAANRNDNKRTGKEVTKRVRQRFGHPAMSSDGTGRTIGTLENFSVKDGKLLHDTQFYNAARLSPAFSGDVVEYIFSLAEEAPESLNESAVIESDLVWILESGDEVELTDAEYDQADWDIATPPEGSTTEFPILRPFSVGHIDLVSDGTLTDSLFGDKIDTERFFNSAFSGHSSLYAFELFELMDRFRDQTGLTLDEIEGKGVEIITKYVYARRKHTQANEGETIIMAKKKNTSRPNISQIAYEQGEGAIETVEEVDDAAIVSETVTTVPDVEPIVDQPEIEDSSEPVSTTDEDESETDVDDDLEEIEAILAETEDDEADSPSSNALAQLQGQIAELSGIVDIQGARIEKVAALLLQQANQLQAISRNLQRMDGERVITERVPLTNRQAADQLEPTDHAQDFTPPLHGYVDPERQTVGMRQFSSVIDGDPPDLVLASDSPNAVAEKAAQRRVERNQRYRMGTRK